jgi:hypothetical protein
MSTPGTTNRAVGLSRFGSPEVLGVVSVPVAASGPLDALVRVRAAAVNPSDTLLRTGRQAERLGGISPPFIPGMDLAGTSSRSAMQLPELVFTSVGPWQELYDRGGRTAAPRRGTSWSLRPRWCRYLGT